MSLKIAREAEKKGNEIQLVSTFTELIPIGEFNERMIRQYQETETVRSQLELLKAKIEVLTTEVKSTPELESFMKKLIMAEKLKDLENLKKKAIEIGKQLELSERDMISLRTIQSNLKLIREKGIVDANLL